jgi:HAAS domain-containing protein
VTIAAYLAELRRCLRHRPLARRRILEEAEAHLLESADEVGEEEAIRRFGPARVVAAGYPPRWGLVGGASAAVGLVAALGAIENVLPPAPWPSAAATPASVALPHQLALLCAAFGLVALLLRRAVPGSIALALAASLALASELRRAWLYDALGVSGLAWWEVAAEAAALGAVVAVALVAAVAERASTS